MAFGESDDRFPHIALCAFGEDALGHVPLLRIHSECMTGDLFQSTRCDCGAQLSRSLSQIAKEGGMLIYLRQEGRGIGLVEKLKAYNLQDDGLDTIEANEALGHGADEREYGLAVSILKEVGWSQVRLITNNPDKMEALEHAGIEVVQRVALEVESNPDNAAYLSVKKSLMGHWLDL